MKCLFVSLAAVVLLGSVAQTQSTFVETFEGGTREGGWSYGQGNDPIEPSGGNPGAYLHGSVYDFWVEAHTAWGVPSFFTGDYRARGVTSVGVDLNTFWSEVDFGPLTVMLRSDNGTPSDGFDDWGAFHVGSEQVPLPGQGWRSFDFEIPSEATSLPPDWWFISFGPDSPPNPDWNELVSSVARLIFYYGPPVPAAEREWNGGLDNPRIASLAGAGGPGWVSPTMTIDRVSSSEIRLASEPRVCLGTADHGVYEGILGDWDSHTSVTCSDTLGDLGETIPISPGNRYYLVVPLNDSHEGSYGLDSSMNERLPAGSGACRTSQALDCL